MSQPTQYATKVAIALPLGTEVQKALGEKYSPGVLNVTKMLAATGDCFAPVVALVKALFQSDDVDPEVREVITLRVAVLLNAPTNGSRTTRWPSTPA